MPPHSAPQGIPSYQKWMKETHTWTKPRSSQLKELDAAILDYDNSKLLGRDAKLHSIRFLLDAWEKKEGSHWMRSVRNQTGIITALDKFLKGTTTSLPEDARKAWRIVCDAAKDNCKNMFQGKKLTVKNTAIGGTLVSIGTTANSAYSAVQVAYDVHKGTTQIMTAAAAAAPAKPLLKSAAAAGHAVYTALTPHNLVADVRTAASAISKVTPAAIEHAAHELLKACLDVDDIKEVMHQLGPAYHEVMKAVTPFLGMVSNGIGGAYGWVKVIEQGWEKHKLGKVKDAQAFAVGDPEAAFDAVLVIVQRNLEAQIGDASITTVAFGLQTGLFFADGGVVSGPAVGAASAIAKLLSQIIQFARDLKEMKNANEQLARGPWGVTLFKTCPLLGCYLIACSETSAVLNLMADEFGGDQWVDKVELLKAKADPAIAKASELIRASRYEIIEFRQSKGVVVPHPKTFGYNPFKHAGAAIADVQRSVQRVEDRLNDPLRKKVA